MNDKMLDFILQLNWSNLDCEVKEQALKCFLDLTGVICAGAKNNSSKCAAAYVSANFVGNQSSVLASGKRSSLIGAAVANGMAANALDMDDGYSITKGHPGAGFIGALLSAADFVDCTYGDLLTALVVGYEVSIRQGLCLQDYYKYYHSTGCYSAMGTAASVGKIMKLSREQLRNALSIADYLSPLVPVERDCSYPSMNKDGIYFGQQTGMQAVLMAKNEITGKNPVINDEKYSSLLDSLGSKYYIMDLYFKFYSCCRWAHSGIEAVAEIMAKEIIQPENISKISIYSYAASGLLYRKPPKNEDEAQYNIIYPIAASIIWGDCSPAESSTDRMIDSRVVEVMNKIEFKHDREFDSVFPRKRRSRAIIQMKDGRTYTSSVHEPRGEYSRRISVDEIVSKVTKINQLYADDKDIVMFINAVLDTRMNEPASKVIKHIKSLSSADKSGFTFV